LIAGKFAEAIEAYKKIKREKPGDNAVAEGRLNYIGYSLLEQKNIAAAIAVFKANVELYPQSSNVYDSLGEAYMANGEKELAIANCKKSLELNPQNKNAIEMLKKLEQP
jgi:tetratricopeptide (TPR) repeat protein